MKSRATVPISFREPAPASPLPSAANGIGPNPPLSSIKWGPRNNTNIQESALLFALHKVAEDQQSVSRKLLDEK